MVGAGRSDGEPVEKVKIGAIAMGVADGGNGTPDYAEEEAQLVFFSITIFSSCGRGASETATLSPAPTFTFFSQGR